MIINNGVANCPQNTIKNVRNELELFIHKLYTKYSGAIDFIEKQSYIRMADKESFVTIAMMNSDDPDEGLFVWGGAYSRRGNIYGSEIPGFFKGYQEACRQAFLLFMKYKCGDVWGDQC